MADITMCTNKNCPLEKMCYRRQAKPNEQRQSYCMFQYDLIWESFDRDYRVECKHYWPVKFDQSEGDIK